MNRLEAYSTKRGAKSGQSTRFSEEEVNSFLAFELSAKYHPSLKSLAVNMEEARLQGVAQVDFDKLAMTSKKIFTRLIASLFTGTHSLKVRGKLVAEAGKAHFELEHALFDDTSLPNVLVEEIITTVGKRQKPPFDPLQPSRMPYGIQQVELHQGFIMVHQ